MNILKKTMGQFFKNNQFNQNISESNVAHMVLVIFLGILLFLRRSDALLNSQPWAEDGVIFIQQAIEYSFSSLFISYAGYFHTIPRLVTLFSLQFGLQNTPFIMNFLSLLIATFSISYFFNKKFRFIIKNDYLRFASTFFILLMPIQEIFLNITNIQWFLAIYLTLWTSDFIFNYGSVFQSKLNIRTILQMVFTVLAFLTTPLAFLLVPFLILTVIRRSKCSQFFTFDFFILYLVPIISVLLYIIICISVDASRSAEIPSLINIVRIFSAQVVAKLFYSNSHEIVSQFGYAPSYLISTFVVLFLILAAFKKRTTAVDIWLWSLIILDILLISISSPDFNRMFSSYNIMGGERYLFYPMTWLLILFIRHFNTFDRNKIKYLIYLCLALFLINATFNYELHSFEDLSFKSYANDFDLNGQSTCTIPINPLGWFMIVPCNQDYMPDWNNLKHVTGGIMAIDLVDNKLYFHEGEIIYIDKKINEHVLMTGWAVDNLSNDGNVKTYLVFKNEDDEIIVPTKNKSRPDVAKMFGIENFNNSGWITTIQPMNFKEQYYNISLRILRANGEEYYELNADKALYFS